MNAIIFAGGNQTRFGKTLEEQPKVLYPLKNGQTVLSNTISQLDRVDLERIIIFSEGKEFIKNYIDGIKEQFNTPIEIDPWQSGGKLGNFIFHSEQYIPATYIFGDIFFPENSLVPYFKSLEKENFIAFIGGSNTPVGDYSIQVENGLVKTISKTARSDFFTCGIFSILSAKILQAIKKENTFTETFRQLPEQGNRTGIHIFSEKLVDLDTFEKTHELH